MQREIFFAVWPEGQHNLGEVIIAALIRGFRERILNLKHVLYPINRRMKV